MFLNDAAFRVNHFGTKKTGTRFTQQPHPGTCGICFDLAAIKIEKAHEEDAGAILHLAHELPPRAIRDFTMRNDALNLYYFACGRIADRIKMCFILIAQR